MSKIVQLYNFKYFNPQYELGQRQGTQNISIIFLNYLAVTYRCTVSYLYPFLHLNEECNFHGETFNSASLVTFQTYSNALEKMYVFLDFQVILKCYQIQTLSFLQRKEYQEVGKRKKKKRSLVDFGIQSLRHYIELRHYLYLLKRLCGCLKI